MVFIRTLLHLLTACLCVFGAPQWPPCKLQCENNFARNEITQAGLIPVCQRGCDLFTVAYISTPKKASTRGHITFTRPAIRSEKAEEHKQIKTALQTESDSIKQQSRIHHTTAQPTSHPVQDHPVQHDQATTGVPVGKELREKPYAVDSHEVNQTNASRQGARFQHEGLSVKKNSRVEQAKHSCRHACVTAYGGATQQEACVVGCHLQATTASLSPEEEEEIQTEASTPFAVFQQVMFNLAGHMGRFVRVSWSWSSQSRELQEDKGEGFGSEDLTRRAQVPMFVDLGPLISPEEIQNDGFKKDDEFNIESIIAKFDHRFNSLRKEHQVSNNNKESKGTVVQMQTVQHQQKSSIDQQQMDLLECISRKSGLPRWFIAVTILCSALVVLWLCFTLTALPEETKVVKAKLPLDEFDEFDTEDDEETLAPVLPAKVAITDTAPLISNNLEKV